MDPEKRAHAGAWLKRAREDRGISVRKVAAHFDVSTQSVYGWEAGGSDFVDDERAEGIAEVFGVDIEEVRRGLGLWMPADRRQAPPVRPDTDLPGEDELDQMSRDELLAVYEQAQRATDAVMRRLARYAGINLADDDNPEPSGP